MTILHQAAVDFHVPEFIFANFKASSLLSLFYTNTKRKATVAVALRNKHWLHLQLPLQNSPHAIPLKVKPLIFPPAHHKPSQVEPWPDKWLNLWVSLSTKILMNYILIRSCCTCENKNKDSWNLLWLLSTVVRHIIWYLNTVQWCTFQSQHLRPKLFF